jgi:hypothetical protein
MARDVPHRLGCRATLSSQNEDALSVALGDGLATAQARQKTSGACCREE